MRISVIKLLNKKPALNRTGLRITHKNYLRKVNNEYRLTCLFV